MSEEKKSCWLCNDTGYYGGVDGDSIECRHPPDDREYTKDGYLIMKPAYTPNEAEQILRKHGLGKELDAAQRKIEAAIKADTIPVPVETLRKVADALKYIHEADQSGLNSIKYRAEESLAELRNILGDA